MIELIDALDGSQASETIRFGLDGAEYEIDLTKQNAESLRGLLTRYVDAGRKISGRARRPAVGIHRGTKAIPRWATENSITVNSLGRISDDVVKQYRASQD